MAPPRFLKNRKVFVILILALGLTVSAAVWKKVRYNYNIHDKEFYLTQEQVVLLRPGLNIELGDWTIEEDGTVKVKFTAKDDGGMPLDLDGVYTPGPIRVSFVFSRIPAGASTYLSYVNRVQTSPITGDSAEQPTSDSGGTIERMVIGSYEYTFGFKLPAEYDSSVTHTIAFYSDRNLNAYGLGTPMDDGVLNFVPSGAEIMQIRDVVSNAACDRCHDPLRIHGRRRSVEVCVTCHYPDVIDPDTGNTVDLSVMVHKIHYGEELPSVQAGTPYQIIGFRQSVHDYSDVVFPQDHRNCVTCHAADATQADRFKTTPTRAACQSCHDDVNWETGENHAGGPADSDDRCANCHQADGMEFDISVTGAHTIPSKSMQLAGVNMEILDVMHSGPGSAPAVHFRLTNDDGSPIDPADMNRLRILMAGPNEDYTYQITEDAKDGSMPVGDATPAGASMTGEYMYTFESLIPDDAEGSFAMGAEGRRAVVLNPGSDNEISHNEQMDNPVFYFAVTDDEVSPRRQMVDDAKCETCHEDLALHGSNRRNASGYCQFCHNTQADDSAVRPEEELPARSIDFRMLIHRVHRGVALANDYTVFGFRSSEHNYNHAVYPGDLRNCDKCHVNNSWRASEGVTEVPTPSEFYTPMKPNSAACLGCHDELYTQAHAFIQSPPFGEACGACHGPGKEFSVSESHAR